MNYSYTQAREEHYRDECSHYDYMQEAYGPSAPDPLYEYYCSIEFEGTFREFKKYLQSKPHNVESVADVIDDNDCPF